VPVESLPGPLGVSRSTLYRNMKGTVQMSAEVQARFADVLKLDANGRAEFDRLSQLVAFDPTLVEARFVLDRFIFASGAADEPNPEPIRFAVYEDDIYLRTSDRVYERIRTLAASPDATTKIHIANCAGDKQFCSVASFIDDVLRQTDSVTVEHLLSMPQSDYNVLVATITRLVPLLRNNRYTVHYAPLPPTEPRRADATFAASPAQPGFGNSLSVEVDRPGDKTFFLLSFLDDDLSTCLVTHDENVIEFFHTNYEAVKRSYSKALVDFSNVDPFTDTLADLEEGKNTVLIKPDFCFDRIPIPVYESMLARMPANDVARMQKQLASNGGDPTTIVQMVLGSLERRARGSLVNRHTDVYSMAGLTRFAETGRISDHLDVMPPFTPDERRAVLTHARSRLADPHDPYTLYITRDDFLTNGCIIISIDNVGVLFEYNVNDYRRGVLSNLFIANHALAEIFSDYANVHVPQTHALSREDADAFLAALIEAQDHTAS